MTLTSFGSAGTSFNFDIFGTTFKDYSRTVARFVSFIQAEQSQGLFDLTIEQKKQLRQYAERPSPKTLCVALESILFAHICNSEVRSNL